MTPNELAALLNGRTYMHEITKDEEAQAKADGLVILFGYSDDNVELRGAINDELPAYEGTTLRVTPLGLLPNWDILVESETEEAKFEDYFRRKQAGFQNIVCEWAPSDEPSLSWRFKTEIPHATFDVMEDGEVYCRGLVFALEDVKP